MKRILLLIFFVASFISSRAQNGLEGIIVEKYYVSNAADAAGSTGVLPAGSVTYRIFVDLLPGYTFQAAYGVAGHELRFQTTTSFFNNEDFGSTAPTYSKNNARFNTTMLDTWLSGGAACAGNFGILKSEDNVASGGATVINADGILQNADPTAGVPLTTQDGLWAGTTPSVTLLGFTPNQLAILDNVSNTGNLISTTNASWAVLGGSTGPTPANKILIGQFTTNGVFSFELNIQIGTPTPGVSQNYVAKNPVGNEIIFPGLIFPAPSNPTAQVSIAANRTFPICAGTSVTFTATPVNGGTTPSYQWKRNGSNVGTNSPTWTNSNLNNSDVITCIMTSSISGALNNPATSNAITANVLNAPAVPTVTATGSTTYCQGANSCTLSTALVAGNTYQWFKGTTAVAGATGTSYTPNATTSNNYKVTVTNSVGCSKTSTTTAITVNPNPTATITATGPTTYCSGANACTLSANTGAGLLYQWFRSGTLVTGATAATYVPNATSSRNYTVRVTNANGCTKTSTGVAITVNPLPTATVTAQGPTTFCNGDSVVLQANITAGLTYQWLRNSAAISGATANKYTAKTAGTYKVRTTNSFGCSKTSTTSASVVVNCRESNGAFMQEDVLTIYPNPGNGNFNLIYYSENNTDGEVVLEVLDMAGRMIASRVLVLENGVVNTSNDGMDVLSSGVYMVRVVDGESASVKKLIVE
jgi:hypothetical protein